MRKGLFISAAGVAVGAAVGGMVVGAVDVQAACTTTPDCESMGYKYCESECPNGSVACPFDSSKRFCFSPTPYTVTAESCAAQCLNAGSNSCTKNGVTYYESCGSSKCGTGYTCTNGSCVSTCTYTYTASSCSSQCKNVGSTSCVKNGTTYYSSCGSSKCSSGQGCSNGSCVSTSGDCCDDVGAGCGSYSVCKSAYYGFPDCSDMIAGCQASGGSSVFRRCWYYEEGPLASFYCE